jgi:hypothetical protein
MNMVNCIKIFVASIVFFAGCTPTPEPLPNYEDNLTDIEKSLLGTWRYEHVLARSMTFEYADNTMELSQHSDGIGGNRAYLFRRRIAYLPDKTYQLRWIERGDYQLGTENYDNWQPSYGYWSIIDGKLIHNSGTDYETEYELTIEDTTMTRTSDRMMLKAYFPYIQWDSEDIIRQTEVFIKIAE